jgi:hypothetical protein
MNEDLMKRIISQLRMPLVLHRDQDSRARFTKRAQLR